MSLFGLIKAARDTYLVRIKWRKYNIDTGFHAGIRVRMWAKESITIGKNCYIGRDSQIECDVRIGDNVLIANRVAFVGKYDHHYQQIGVPIRLASQIRDKDYDWKGLNQITVVEDDAWIGYGVIVYSGVTIGQGSIIAAGSVVAKDVESFAIYAGVPAKKIRERFENKVDLRNHIELYNQNYKK